MMLRDLQIFITIINSSLHTFINNEVLQIDTTIQIPVLNVDILTFLPNRLKRKPSLEM